MVDGLVGEPKEKPMREVTISGQNLAQATAEAVTFSGTGVIVDRININTNTTIGVSISIFPDASPGARNITVATPVGRAVSPANAVFTVQTRQQGALIIHGIHPNNFRQGQMNQEVTISGQNLARVAAITFSGTGVTVNRILSSTAASPILRGNVSIEPNAPLGPRSFTLTTPGGQTHSPSNVVLMVQDSTPIIAGINPNRFDRETPVETLITGRSLDAVWRGDFPGAGRHESVRSFPGGTQTMFRLTMRSEDPIGPHIFTLHTHPAGSVNSATFGVTYTLEPVSQLTITPAIPAFRPTFGPIIPSTIRLTASPATSSAAMQLVSTVSSIGPTLSGRLERDGIRTVSDLALAQPAQVAQILGISEVRATSFINEAIRLQGQ